jgi:hypothetical protein
MGSPDTNACRSKGASASSDADAGSQRGTPLAQEVPAPSAPSDSAGNSSRQELVAVMEENSRLHAEIERLAEQCAP